MLATYNKDIDKITFRKNNIKITDDITNALNQLKPGMIATSDDLRGLASHLGTSNQGFIDFCQNIKDSKIQLKDGQTYLQAYEEHLQSTSFSFKNLSKSALNGLKSFGATAINALGGMAIFAGISFAVSGVAKLADRLIVTKKELEEMRQEAISSAQTATAEFNNINGELQTNATAIDNISKRYATLAQEVKNIGTVMQSQGTLSTDEYEEFLELGNQIADIFPSLKIGTTESGDAILSLSGNIDTITNSINNAMDASERLAVINLEDKMDTITEGFRNEVNSNSDNSLANKYNNANTYLENLKQGFEELSYDLNESKSTSLYSEELANLFSSAGYNYDDFYYGGAFDFSGLSEDEYNVLWENIKNSYAKEIEKAEDNLYSAKEAIDSANKEYAEKILTVFQYKTQDLDDVSKQIFNSYISNLGYDTLMVANDLNDFGDIENWINANILDKLKKGMEEHGNEVSKYYNKLLSINPNTALAENIPVIEEYINKLAEILNIDAEQLQLAFGIDIQEDEKLLSTAKDRLGFNSNASSEADANRNAEINKFVNTLNEEDLNTFIGLDIPDEAYNYTSEELTEWLKKEQEKMNTTPLTTPIELATSIDSVSTAFDDLYQVLDDYQKNGLKNLDISNLLNLNKEDTFGNIDGSTAAYENFLSILQDVNSTSEDVQDAFDELASAYIYHSELAKQITEDNEDYIKSELEKNGVTNASQVAEQMLINKYGAEEVVTQNCIKANLSLNGAKLTSQNAAEQLGNATSSEILALANEANALGMSRNAFILYAIEKMQANSSTLTTDGDIQNLLALCEGLDAAIPLIKAYQSAKDAALNLEGTAANEANKAADGYLNQVKSLVKSKPKMNTTSFYNGYNGRNGSENLSVDESSFSKLFDWLERRISKLTTQTERWAAIIENATDDKRLNTYYKKLQSGYSSLAKTYSSAADYYLKQAEKVGLSKAYQNKVKNGTINLEEITKEKLADKITSYQEYWDKYQEYLDDFIEAHEKLANVPLEKAASKIELLSDALDLLDAKLDNISVKNYKKANTNLDEQTQNVKNQLNADKEARTAAKKNYQAAKSAVQKKANLGSDDLAGNKNKQTASKKAIQNAVAKGNEINLALYKEGSSGYKAAVKYNAALKAQKETINAVALSQEEYTKTLRENAKAKFDNISNYYSSIIGLRDNEISAIDNKISELETAGKNVNKRYYEEQKKINNRKLAFYKDEKSALEESLKSIPKYTDEWYDAKDAIQECENAISECVEETYNLNNAINSLYFDMYDDIADGIDRIIAEQEFLQSLFEHENTTDSNTGTFTNAGIAKLGSTTANYYMSTQKVREDENLLNQLQATLKYGKKSDGIYEYGDLTFNSLDDLQAKIDEVYTTWQNDIKDTYSYESDIVDLMKDKYQAELDLLKELIDAKTDALQAEKDLHDYQQTIQEKTQDISTIQKQIAAYKGDTSGEGLAKLQKLQVQLSEKENDLRETEYDRYISDQEDMLDKLYDEYEELVTKKLDDFMELVGEGLKTADENTANINSFLHEVATSNGYKIETDGLFTTVSGAIYNSTDKIVSALGGTIIKNSGTQMENKADDAPAPIKGDTQFSSGSTSKSTLTAIYDSLPSNSSNADYRNATKEFISSKAQKAAKKRSEYGAVNQAIYDNAAKAYSGTGKILSGSNLKELSKILGVKYDNATKNGTLYKKLKSIKFPGFSKGGIVSVDDVKKQITENGDTGLVSVHNGEGILTPLQTALFGELTQKLPELNQALNLMGNIVDLPSLPTLSDIPTVKSNTTIGDMVFNIDLPNVTNPEEFVKAIQNEPKVQKALRAVTTDRLAGNGRLSVRNII